MALGTNHVTLTEVTAASGSRTRSNSAFVPELWGDEVIASYKANLVMPQLTVVMNHVGKKGDTVHIPRPVRGSASAKVAETQVTLIANQELSSPYIIDQHWEYSRLIEDIVTVQADPAFRRFYTDDAGYALAKKVDTDIHAKGATFAGADAAPTVAGTAYSKARVGTGGAWVATTAGNAATLSDGGLRQFIQNLDDSDVPSMGRVLVLPPVEKQKLMGVARFTEQAFTGEAGAGNTIRNGYVGNLYGVEIYVSTNCASFFAADGTTAVRAALLFQKEALLLMEQLRPRVQTQYKQEWLSDLFTSDMIYGTGLLRPEAGIAIIVPA